MERDKEGILNGFRHEGPRHDEPRHEGPKHEAPGYEEPKHEDDLGHHMDELLIRISGNKRTLNEIKQVVIEFKNSSLEKEAPKPDKEEKGKVLCERKK